MAVRRMSDSEKLSRVVGRLVDTGVQKQRLSAEEGKKMLKKLQEVIDASDDREAAHVLNGIESEPQV